MVIGNTNGKGGFCTITILKDDKVVATEDSRKDNKLLRNLYHFYDEGGTFTAKIYVEDSVGNKAEWTDQITI